uniref:Uncharacterized protein n=1 Tax=Anguilla anguilla TaxID=7936 RepID=A0A0E9UBR7_ANGAN
MSVTFVFSTSDPSGLACLLLFSQDNQ